MCANVQTIYVSKYNVTLLGDKRIFLHSVFIKKTLNKICNIKHGAHVKNIKSTKPSENFLKAFARESRARNCYTYYASKARKEGY